MRADRLVAIQLLLQERGQVTAAEIAAELEISERTARRDLDALSMAGIPVYAVQGRGGGWRLAGGGRTDLSGLTRDEARALFLLAGPAAQADKDVRAALRKLMRALPEGMRAGAAAASERIVLDPAGWDRSEPRFQPGQLQALQSAVIEGVELRLGYMARDGTESDRIVQPLGIVAKGAVWYLVADTEGGLRSFRVDRVSRAVPTGRPATRPDGFDLDAYWRVNVERIDQMRTPVTARARVATAMIPVLRAILGRRLTVEGSEGDTASVVMRGHRIESLAAEVAGFGSSVVVLDPPELVGELARIGRELLENYG